MADFFLHLSTTASQKRVNQGFPPNRRPKHAGECVGLQLNTEVMAEHYLVKSNTKKTNFALINC